MHEMITVAIMLFLVFRQIGVPFPDSKRRISRQILTDMNVAQLQVIVNDLHTQIESEYQSLFSCGMFVNKGKMK